jgi:hypothetical protein
MGNAKSCPVSLIIKEIEVSSKDSLCYSEVFLKINNDNDLDRHLSV